MSWSPIRPRAHPLPPGLSSPASSSTGTPPLTRRSTETDQKAGSIVRTALHPPHQEPASPASSSSVTPPKPHEVQGDDRKRSIDGFATQTASIQKLKPEEADSQKPILYLQVVKGNVQLKCFSKSSLLMAVTPGKKEVFAAMTSGKLQDGSVLIADPVVVNQYLKTLNLTAEEKAKLTPFFVEHGGQILEAAKLNVSAQKPATSSETPMPAGSARFHQEFETSKAWLDGSIVTRPEWQQMDPAIRQEKLADAITQRPIENSEVIRGLCGVPRDAGFAQDHDSIDFAGALKVPLKDGTIAVVQYAYDGTGHAVDRGVRESRALAIKEMENKIVQELSSMSAHQLTEGAINKLFENADTGGRFGGGMFALSMGDRTFFSLHGDGVFIIYRPGGNQPSTIYKGPGSDSVTMVRHTPPGTEIITLTDGSWDAPLAVARDALLGSMRQRATVDEDKKLEAFFSNIVEKERNQQHNKAYAEAKNCIGMIKGKASEEDFKAVAEVIDRNIKVPGFGAALQAKARDVLLKNPETTPKELADELLDIYEDSGVFVKPTHENTLPESEVALINSTLHLVFTNPEVGKLTDSISNLQQNINQRKSNLLMEMNTLREESRSEQNTRSSRAGFRGLFGKSKGSGASETVTQAKAAARTLKIIDELQGNPGTPLADLNVDLLKVKDNLKKMVHTVIPTLTLGEVVDQVDKKTGAEVYATRPLVLEIIGTMGLEMMFGGKKPESLHELIEKSLEIGTEKGNVDDTSGTKYTIPWPLEGKPSSSSL